VLLGDHRIVERVVLVIELDDRARQLRALLHAQTLGQRAGSDIAHDDFERNDLDLADQLFAHVEPANEMRRHADRIQVLKHIFGNAIVEDALAVDDLVFLGVEGGRVVLEMLDEGSRLGALVQHFGLAFVYAAAAVHWRQPRLEKSMGCAAAPWFALQRRPMRDWLDQAQKVAIRRAALPIDRCQPVVAVSAPVTTFNDSVAQNSGAAQ